MSQSAVNWDDLRIFLEVARQGTVNAAARRLKLDHSTVCRRVGKLETMLSIKLLDRTKQGIVVRAEARELIKHIEQMDRHASSLDDVMVRGRAEAAQVVRVATMEGLASRYIARRLPLLERFAPNVRLELVSIPQLVNLSRKEADIFLSFFAPKLPGLDSKRVAEFALFLYCSDAYLRTHGRPRSRDGLKDHVFISYIEDLLAIDAVRWLDEAIQSPKTSFNSNSIIAQCSAAEDGMGIAMLPSFVAAGLPRLVRLIPDQVVVRREVWMSVRVGQTAPARIQGVMKFLSHVFALDKDFLMGRTERLEGSPRKRA